MTGGGDTDEIEDDVLDESDDVADEVEDIDDAGGLGGAGDGEADAPVGSDVALNDADPDPTAGASDVGGLPGGIDAGTDQRGEDQHEVGGGQTGMGKGPTGS